MRIFITGVSGYLGRSMALHFKNKAHHVSGSSRTGLAIPGMNCVHLALGDPVHPGMLEGFETLIHAAHDFGRGAREKNVKGTLLLLDAAAKAGVRQQIFLTSYSARADAASEYGRTKYELERRFLDAGATALRLGLVVGNGGMFAGLRRSLLRTPIVPLIGGGTDPVALVGISHVLAATEAILHAPASGVLGLFYDAKPPMKDFIREVKRHAGQRTRFLPVGLRFAIAAVSVARSIGLSIGVDPGQIRALQLNQSAPWQSDLPTLLPGRCGEFQLAYALEELATGI